MVLYDPGFSMPGNSVFAFEVLKTLCLGDLKISIPHQRKTNTIIL